MRPFSEQLSRFRLWRDTERVHQRLTDLSREHFVRVDGNTIMERENFHDMVDALSELGEARRALGESLMPDRFEAAARCFAQAVAEDILAEETDLDALDEPEAYCHALKDLTGMLVDHVASDASEAVELWLATRKAGAN